MNFHRLFKTVVIVFLIFAASLIVLGERSPVSVLCGAAYSTAVILFVAKVLS